MRGQTLECDHLRIQPFVKSNNTLRQQLRGWGELGMPVNNIQEEWQEEGWNAAGNQKPHY